MKGLKRIYEPDRKAWYTPRARDVKIGEKVQLAPSEAAIGDWLSRCTAAFVLLGAEEDIGIRANYGRPGADANWEPFLKAFMNMQANVFFHGDQVAVLGVYRPAAATGGLFEQVSALDQAANLR